MYDLLDGPVRGRVEPTPPALLEMLCDASSSAVVGLTVQVSLQRA